jgi:hypothetical protein
LPDFSIFEKISGDSSAEEAARPGPVLKMQIHPVELFAGDWPLGVS